MSLSPDRYSVGLSESQREQLFGEDEWALKQSLRDEFRKALAEIDYRLRFEADEWGESREVLQHLAVQMRCGTARMITVVYGVDDANKVVFVKEFRINRDYRA